jgi:hypothetical protein
MEVASFVKRPLHIPPIATISSLLLARKCHITSVLCCLEAVKPVATQSYSHGTEPCHVHYRKGEGPFHLECLYCLQMLLAAEVLIF